MLNQAVNQGQPTLNRAERRRQKRSAKRIASGGGTQAQDPAILLTAAELLRQRGELDAALEACQKIAETYPRLTNAQMAMGTVLSQMGRPQEGYEWFKTAVELEPDNVIAWRRFGKCLYDMKQFEAALIAYRRATAIEPFDLDTLLQVGRTLQHIERAEEALEVFTIAVERYPESATAMLELGLQQQALGQFEKARETLERAIELDPDQIGAHYRLVAMGGTGDDPDATVATLAAQGERKDAHPLHRAAAYFAIARTHAKAKRLDEAFEAYRTANDILDPTVTFDGDGIARYVDVCSRAFTPEAFALLEPAGAQTDAPVFILGMPRSGTTLVEQIVSSHPAIGAGGEERKFTQLAEELLKPHDGDVKYPAHVAQIDPLLLAPLGGQYYSHMRARIPDAERFTDKNPFNFFHVGLIAILFPKATILHCHRDPMDTCLSCYFQFFGDAMAMSFTTSQKNIATFYNEYRRLMAHWHEVLPGRIMDVCYEEMISDQEGLSRRIIEHIGLPWDDACLRFNENERGVRTASQFQVRKPIYNSSVGRWRAYDAHLGELKAGLGIE